MSRLEELFQKNCQDGVEYRPLEKCCLSLDNKRKPVTKGARESGEYPYYGANGIQDYVSDYIFDGTFVLVGEDGSVITPTGNPVVNWAEGKIWVNNHAHIIAEGKGVLLRYLYHYLQTVDVTPYIHGNIPKFTGGDFKALKIPVPPIEVQREIVRILDNFTKLTAELTAELTARKKQYEYYRDQLLNFEKTGGMERHNLGDVVAITRGVRVVREQLAKVGFYPVYQNSLTPLGYAEKPNRDGDTTFVIAAGAAGEVGYCKDAFWAADDCFCFDCPETIKSRFLFHVLKNQQDILYSKVRRSSVPRISRDDVERIKVPVPSLEIQNRIVNVLDNFDAICSDLNIGLPAEIEARNKQYAYYRDLLLSFDRSQFGNVEREREREQERGAVTR